MRKLSEFRGEEALDVLADLIEPASEIMTDKELVALFKERNMATAAKVAIKNHKRAVLDIMARLNDEDPATYAPSLFALPMMLLDVLNDPELLDLFMYQGQKTEPTSSGSASENTEAQGE